VHTFSITFHDRIILNSQRILVLLSVEKGIPKAKTHDREKQQAKAVLVLLSVNKTVLVLLSVKKGIPKANTHDRQKQQAEAEAKAGGIVAEL